jgi:hypothetical protein
LAVLGQAARLIGPDRALTKQLLLG